MTLEMAERVSPGGSVVGLDMDAVKLDLARKAAADRGITNVEFRTARVQFWNELRSYDAAYSRFLLQHLSNPTSLIRRMWGSLRRGGVLMIEDVDHDTWACYPRNEGFEFYRRALAAVIDNHGGDHAIGRKLFSCCLKAGVPRPSVQAVTPLYMEGEGRFLPVSTLDSITDSVVVSGIATRKEVGRARASLRRFLQNPRALVMGPTNFQLSAKR